MPSQTTGSDLKSISGLLWVYCGSSFRRKIDFSEQAVTWDNGTVPGVFPNGTADPHGRLTYNHSNPGPNLILFFAVLASFYVFFTVLEYMNALRS